MVDIEEIYVRDLYGKHNKRFEYRDLYSVGKKIYRDDGEIGDNCFDLDKEKFRILKAKIDALLIDKTKHATNINKNKNKPTIGRQANLI